MTETSTEPSAIVIEEDNVTEVFQEQGEKKFITIPCRHRGASKSRITRCRCL